MNNLKNYQSPKLAVGFIAVTLLTIWIYHFITSKPPLSVLPALLICTLGGISVFYILTKKFSIQGCFFVIALVTGFYGYKFLGYKEYSYTNALYSTFRLFILDVDNVFTKDGTKFATYPLSIEIARWSAAAYTISTIFLFIYKLFGQSSKLLWYKLFGGHIVISGLNEKSKILIENLQKQGKRIVLITDEIQDAQLDYFQQLGVTVTVGNHGDGNLYKKVGISRAEYILIFHDDDSKNINELLSLGKYTHHLWDKLKAKQIIVHLANRKSYILYEDVEAEMGKEIDGKFVAPPIRVINLHRLIAEKLLNEKPLYIGYEEMALNSAKDPLHILIIGFGSLGQEIAVQAMERSHFINSKKILISVFDKDIDKVKKSWYQSYPKSDKVADITFQALDVETSHMEETVAGTSQKITHIFFCLNSDFRDMIEGIEIAKKYPEIPIFIKMTKEVQVSKWLDKNEQVYKNVHLFGNIESILNDKFIINEELETIAKKIHDKYRIEKEKETGKKQLKWDEISDFLKESNRNQANHLETKLMLMGFAITNADHQDDHVLTKEEFSQTIEPGIEKMAAIEHARWNAFYHLRGWDVMTEVIDKKTKDMDRKLHACMVSYEELDRIKDLTDEDYKEYDRQTIRNLYECLEIKSLFIKKKPFL